MILTPNCSVTVASLDGEPENMKPRLSLPKSDNMLHFPDWKKICYISQFCAPLPPAAGDSFRPFPLRTSMKIHSEEAGKSTVTIVFYVGVESDPKCLREFHFFSVHSSQNSELPEEHWITFLTWLCMKFSLRLVSANGRKEMISGRYSNFPDFQGKKVILRDKNLA